MARSNGNNLKKESIPSLRGAIYDRNGIAMSWNGETGREYGEVAGSGHVLGYIGMPTKEILEDNKNISSDDIVGKDGTEEWYDKFLRGVSGSKAYGKRLPRQYYLGKRSG